MSPPAPPETLEKLVPALPVLSGRKPAARPENLAEPVNPGLQASTAAEDYGRRLAPKLAARRSAGVEAFQLVQHLERAPWAREEIDLSPNFCGATSVAGCSGIFPEIVERTPGMPSRKESPAQPSEDLMIAATSSQGSVNKQHIGFWCLHPVSLVHFNVNSGPPGMSPGVAACYQGVKSSEHLRRLWSRDREPPRDSSPRPRESRFSQSGIRLPTRASQSPGAERR